MILLAHMLFGTAIGLTIKNIPLAIIVAFLSHYFLDLFPHIEYDISNAGNNNFSKALSDRIKIAIDFALGILTIWILCGNNLLAYFYGACAIIPDGLAFLTNFSPNKILASHNYLHIKKIHFLRENKKISVFWRILSQIVTVVASIIMLKT